MNITTNSQDAFTCNLTSTESWNLMNSNQNFFLVDVRTPWEWQNIGIPDLKSNSEKYIQISWKMEPNMNINPNFLEELQKKISDKEANIFFICRSGGRSAQAAQFALKGGFKNCYNISDGFEGHGNELLPGWKNNEILNWKRG